MLPFRLPSLGVSEGDLSAATKGADEDEDSGRLRMFESPDKPDKGSSSKSLPVGADSKVRTVIRAA